MPSGEFTFALLPSAAKDEHLYRLNGPLVLNNMFAFQGVLRAESVNTILDLTGVPYVDSAGLGILTNSYVSHQRLGRKLFFVGVNDRVGDLFKLTNLDKLFEVFPTIEGARAALNDEA
jgi:anti-anti-sigma factor